MRLLENGQFGLLLLNFVLYSFNRYNQTLMSTGRTITNVTKNVPDNQENLSNQSMEDMNPTNSSNISTADITGRIRSTIYSVLPFLDPGSKSNVIQQCEKVEGDTTIIGRIYKYVFGMFRFPGTDSVFLRTSTTNSQCVPGIFDFIRHIPSYLFYILNLIILLSITYPDSIFTRKQITTLVSLGIGILGFGWLTSTGIQSLKLQKYDTSIILHIPVYILLVIFYGLLASTDKTWNDFFWKLFWVFIFSQIQWIAPLLVLLLGPGIIPLIQQQSFIEFCL
jgi:hypothetical protein